MRLRIGQLAQRSGVSTDTIRYYERIGLLPKAARPPSGHREYGEAAAGKVWLVRNALRFGFSLKQVGTFLGVRQAGGAQCKNVRAEGAKVLEAMECQIAELMVSRDAMVATIRQWDERLAGTPEGQPAHPLEALATGCCRQAQAPGRQTLRANFREARSTMKNCTQIIWVFAFAMASAQDDQEPTRAKPSEHADHMNHRFDNAADWAKSFDDPARDAWQMPDKVIATLKLKAGQALADIGAGTGYFSVRLAKANAKVRVYGVDIEPSMVEYLRSRAMKEGLTNITAIQAEADSPKLPAGVDLVLIVDTFHHIPNRVQYFRKLSSSLNKGGRIAIIDFKPEATMGPPKEFRFTSETIAAEPKDAGFKQIEKPDFLPQQNFLIFKK